MVRIKLHLPIRLPVELPMCEQRFDTLKESNFTTRFFTTRFFFEIARLFISE